MPVQINEVIVRAVVAPSASGSTGTGGQPECPPPGNSGDAELQERVLEILKEKTER